MSVTVPPATSAAMVPLLTMERLPPAITASPIVPFCPRMVTPEPIVRTVPLFSSVIRLVAPASPNTMVPVPPSVWSPTKARTLVPLMLTVPPCRVSPSVDRTKLVDDARSAVPARVTPLSRLLPLLVARRTPPVLVVTVPPAIDPPLSRSTPLFAAASPPVPVLVTAVLTSSVPPLAAESVPPLVMDVGTSEIVPPLTSALMVPLLTRLRLPPAITASPMVPFPPRIVTLGPRVTTVPLFSSVTRLPAPLPNTMPPVPPMV